MVPCYESVSTRRALASCLFFQTPESRFPARLYASIVTAPKFLSPSLHLELLRETSRKDALLRVSNPLLFPES